jgi:hypothetical protein
MHHPDYEAASLRGKLFCGDQHGHRPLAEQEHARQELRPGEADGIRCEAGGDREDGVSGDRPRQQAPPAPIIGAADQQPGGHGAEVHGRDQQTCGLFRKRELGAQIREDLGDRDQVVAFEEGGDRQEQEQPSLVGREPT